MKSMRATLEAARMLNFQSGRSSPLLVVLVVTAAGAHGMRQNEVRDGTPDGIPFAERAASGPQRAGKSRTDAYGTGTVSPSKRFGQFVIGTPAKRAVPVMMEFESQKTSVGLPPNSV